ncbi:hypothetical protein [Thioalbus denitrificans]|uniref:Uncharacterized protein n=1 Tax=Thioalbus denitrificans TaxID=547122 RepID=A0A369CGC5_9GAMM|nr:hypothetical protein [Thioalbus denitrificans]RCX33110.1 hypothetical protein DFQ59_101409 [Thioalbus denitrificans]
MAEYFTRETFFRPQPVEQRESALPAPLYNALQRLLRRSESGCVFIPVRSMQYQAVLEREEIIFVDSQGGYAHQDGEGGRLIRIAWQLRPAAERESLSAPVPCTVVYYFPDLRETQWRLMSELPAAVEACLRRRRDDSAPVTGRRVVPLR